MKELAARNGGRVGLAALAAILLLGLGLRLDYAWEGRAPVYDAAAYSRIAANLDSGHGFTLGEQATQPAGNYSPGLPLLAAGVYKASGGVHERTARLVLAMIGSLAVLFTYLIGRRLWRPLASLLGATVIAIYPALLEYQGMLMSEPLAATLLSAAALALLWAADTGTGRSSPRRATLARWLIPGVLLGALTLTRPEYLGVAVLLAVLVFARGLGDQWRRTLAQAAVLLMGMVMIVMPWTIRNAVALDRFVPVSTGGGQVLFAGSYMPSDGDPERVGREALVRHPGLTRELASQYLRAGAPPTLTAVLDRVRLEEILAALAAQRFPGVESDRALSRMGRERLWRNLSEEPLDYAAFIARKVVRVWSHGAREVIERPGWKAFHLIILALALLGFVVLCLRARARSPEEGGNVVQRAWGPLLFATIFISITAISALLVASPRRVLVMLPLVAALAGVGLAWAASAIRERTSA